MAVYVDYITHYEQVKWGACHMMTDGPIEELHEMAKKIGMCSNWFQGGNSKHPHYDLSSRYRILAVQNGAIEVDSVELLKHCDSEFAKMLKEAKNRRKGKVV